MRRSIPLILLLATAAVASSCARGQSPGLTAPVASQSKEATIGQDGMVFSLTVTPTRPSRGETITATVSYRNVSQDDTLTTSLGAQGRYDVTATSSTGTVVFDSQEQRRRSIPPWVNYTDPPYPRTLVLPPAGSESSVVRFTLPVGRFMVRASTEASPNLKTPEITVTVR